jgi:precorrin-2 dehydrogenase/sirohydrochlorin ferrochelatase
LNFHGLRDTVTPMNHYPIYLDITNRRCVVVGGGDVAERKVQRLLDCGARVVIIGKTLTPVLEAMKNEGRIDQIHDDYDETCIQDAFLVIGATDRDDVNTRISADARKRGVMVNIVDDPEKCDFILPSLFQRGDLTVAISTGGKSPALAKKMREELEGLYGREYLILLNLLGTIREKIKARGAPSDDNKRLFEALVNSDILQHIRGENWDRINKMVHDLTGEDIKAGE